MKTIRPRRRHQQHNHSHAIQTSTADVRRMIMQALQAPVPPQLKSWARV